MFFHERTRYTLLFQSTLCPNEISTLSVVLHHQTHLLHGMVDRSIIFLPFCAIHQNTAMSTKDKCSELKPNGASALLLLQNLMLQLKFHLLMLILISYKNSRKHIKKGCCSAAAVVVKGIFFFIVRTVLGESSRVVCIVVGWEDKLGL